MLKKVISGGQTGADRAGLDVAIRHNIQHGGAIPKGRRTEEGVLPEKYKLLEMSSRSYPRRTEKNVVDGDGTVILTHGRLTGGSLLTRQKAYEHDKPVFHLDMARLSVEEAADLLADFLLENGIEVLNVAGTRGSEDPDIYGKTILVLEECLTRLG